MNLNLPVVTTTLGPTWATQLNTALEVVDAHDHSSGKGTKITPSGLNINVDLDFNSNRAAELKSAKFVPQVANLTGATNSNSIHSVNGNLVWTNDSGVAVQLTAGGSIVSTPGAVTNLEFNSFNSNLSISPSDPFVCLNIDTSASRSITLPLASSVATGRIYVVIDANRLSETNPITVNKSGSDTIMGAASYVVESNGAAIMLIGDGLSNWTVI